MKWSIERETCSLHLHPQHSPGWIVLKDLDKSKINLQTVVLGQCSELLNYLLTWEGVLAGLTNWVVSGAVMQGGMEGDGGQSDGGLLEECGGVRGAQVVWCDDVWAGGGGVKPVVLTPLLYAHQSFTPTFSDFSLPSPHVPVISAPASFSRSRSSIKSL